VLQSGVSDRRQGLPAGENRDAPESVNSRG
jgi:hypothetical protein